MTQDTQEKKKREPKVLTEVGTMTKIEALLDPLSLAGKARVIAYFCSAVNERIAASESESTAMVHALVESMPKQLTPPPTEGIAGDGR